MLYVLRDFFVSFLMIIMGRMIFFVVLMYVRIEILFWEFFIFLGMFFWLYLVNILEGLCVKDMFVLLMF